LEGRLPLRAGMATFGAFIVVGLIPLIPFLIPNLTLHQSFVASSVATAFAFSFVGAAKGFALQRPLLRSVLETLLTGGGAAVLAYFIGAWLRGMFGA
jgi:vacuolar iron transporter family protein